MTSRELEYIRIVAEEGNITRAAERLYISQPTLSQCIQRVESQLGEPLFTRNSGGIILTLAGELYLEAANKITKLYRDMENAVSDLGKMKAGRLVVGVPTLLASQIMPRIYSGYVKKYPDIDVILYEQESATLESSLQQGLTDLAIMALPVKGDFAYHTIFSCDMVLCTPPEHPLAEGVPAEGELDITRLDGQPFIRARPHQKTRQVVDAVLRKAGISVQTALMTSSSETAMFLSAHGLGFTILPEFSIRYYQPILPIRYYRIPEEYREPWVVVIAHLRDGYLSRAAERFIQECTGIFPEGY